MSDTYNQPQHGWTCFHCGETFKTVGSARDHFGRDPFDDPGCQIKAGAERGLLMALRKAHAELAEYRHEDTELTRRMAARQYEFSGQLGDAEQFGYERGLKAYEAEVARLRRVVVRYGDRARMSWAPPDLQISIDEAFKVDGVEHEGTPGI